MKAIEDWQKENKLALISFLIIFAGGLSVTFHTIFGQGVMRFGSRSLDDNFEVLRLSISRIVFVCIILQVLALGIIKFHFTIEILKKFFTAVTYPINLAVFQGSAVLDFL